MESKRAYLLGALKGDGWVNFYHYGPTRQHYLIQFFNSSRVFVDTVMDALRSLGIKPRIGSIRRSGWNVLPQIAVQGNNKPFVMWWLNLDYNSMREWLLEDDERGIAFLKGFYEADGTQDSQRIRLSNHDKRLLQVIKTILESLDFHPTLTGGIRSSRPNRKPEYCVSLNRKKERNRFLIMTNPCIKGLKESA